MYDFSVIFASAKNTPDESGDYNRTPAPDESGDYNRTPAPDKSGDYICAPVPDEPGDYLCITPCVLSSETFVISILISAFLS